MQGGKGLRSIYGEGKHSGAVGRSALDRVVAIPCLSCHVLAANASPHVTGKI